ncbi:hypothetical protein WJX73_008717 [Symbiochloris irregularis]|uniref:Hyaluronan/mRNA-binding protein domain-containing protein n=1 Tax=Symbiochloris irregularis TaxID=706552 RepID=A0AAW1NZS2_9CHLO
MATFDNPDLALNSDTAPKAAPKNEHKTYFDNATSVEGGHSNIRHHEPVERGHAHKEPVKKHGQGHGNWGDPKYDDPSVDPSLGSESVPDEKHLAPTSESEEKAAFQDAVQSGPDKTMTLDEYEKKHGPV